MDLSSNRFVSLAEEIVMLKNLSHPNIIAFRDALEHNGSVYIVMDFAEKGDLAGTIDSQKNLRAAQAFKKK